MNYQTTMKDAVKEWEKNGVAILKPTGKNVVLWIEDRIEIGRLIPRDGCEPTSENMKYQYLMVFASRTQLETAGGGTITSDVMKKNLRDAVREVGKDAWV